MLNLKTLAAAAAFVVGVGTTGTMAATVYDLTSTGSCKPGDMTVAADDCWGTVLIINGQDGNSQAGNENNVDVNDSTFRDKNGTFLWTGLFDHQDWSFLTKVNTGDNGGTTEGTDIGLTLDPDTGGSPGNWTVDPGTLSIYERIVIVLKQGSTWAAYLYEGDIPEGGSFSSAAFDQSGGLSHFTIYAGPMAPIPLPAAGFLMLGALGGLGVAARRRKA